MLAFRFNISKKILNSAAERLAKVQLKPIDDDGEPNDCEPTEIVLAENISLNKFNDYCKHHPHLPVKLHLGDGKVIAYEVPLDVHSGACNTIAFPISGWSN
ncbi:hypothetical protein BC937DRAFT_90536 [Endogone sp. FLAS-F59071]|nr:hypothetical protein BC937DRAFT_90536 [Endogone sp. FLAS-F59071]|eukprot:RUS22062.1 hypothetical protein BC937DRAFT_90536 [Endogone sp. FLAS-F59071]